MLSLKTLTASAVVALGLASPAAMAQSYVTFAVGNDTNNNGLIWTDNGNNGVLNTSNTTTGNAVAFNYQGISGLPSFLNSSDISAYELINGGAGVKTTTKATSAGGELIQAINNPFTISYTLANPVTYMGKTLSNLLTATITPVTGNASLVGTAGGRSATYSASTNTNNTYIVTFTSDFLSFKNSISYSVSLAFNSLTPSYTLDANGKYVQSFTATLLADFASDPVPTSIPEAPSAALLIIGMAAVGVAARRRSV